MTLLIVSFLVLMISLVVALCALVFVYLKLKLEIAALEDDVILAKSDLIKFGRENDYLRERMRKSSKISS